MGNTPCTSGGGKAKQIRVLLPDGNIVLMEDPVEAVDLMIEHVNHMVVHCSTTKAGGIGTRPSMRIMQPDEKLQGGQAYVVHPIPYQKRNQKTKFKPQPVSIPKLNSKVGTVQSTRDKAIGGGAEKHELAAERRDQRHSRRGSNKIADSESASRPKLEDAAGITGLKSAPRNIPESHDDHAKEQEHEMEVQTQAEVVNDDDEDVLLNLNMYMGWRPALESIPESPLGYNHQLDLMQAPQVLCV